MVYSFRGLSHSARSYESSKKGMALDPLKLREVQLASRCPRKRNILTAVFGASGNPISQILPIFEMWGCDIGLSACARTPLQQNPLSQQCRDVGFCCSSYSLHRLIHRAQVRDCLPKACSYTPSMAYGDLLWHLPCINTCSARRAHHDLMLILIVLGVKYLVLVVFHHHAGSLNPRFLYFIRFVH